MPAVIPSPAAQPPIDPDTSTATAATAQCAVFTIGPIAPPDYLMIGIYPRTGIRKTAGRNLARGEPKPLENGPVSKLALADTGG